MATTIDQAIARMDAAATANREVAAKLLDRLERAMAATEQVVALTIVSVNGKRLSVGPKICRPSGDDR